MLRKLLRGGGSTHSIFYTIVSLENLLCAWKKLKRGKGTKLSIQVFEYNLESELIKLHRSLTAKTYTPQP